MGGNEDIFILSCVFFDKFKVFHIELAVQPLDVEEINELNIFTEDFYVVFELLVRLG